MRSRKLIGMAILFLTITAGTASMAAARDYISIVGSSTVYPFATVVAETFGKTTAFKTPKVESTGSGGGFKLFGGGLGIGFPDITNASRRIKTSEFERSRANGVRDIIEVKIGYDGIVLANARTSPGFDLTLRDIFLALAKEVPAASGPKTRPNPYKTWKDVNPSLPDMPIRVLGPPPTSGTRDAFVELAMEGGAATFETLRALKKNDPDAFKAVAHTLREDGAFVEAGENDNLIVQKMQTDPTTLGIFGFSFLDQNTDKVQGSRVNGVPPEFEAIADGSYPISRPLYIYVKKAHVGVIPGIQAFLDEFVSERAAGPDGYLAEKGLIPLSDAERRAARDTVKNLVTLSSVK